MHLNDEQIESVVTAMAVAYPAPEFVIEVRFAIAPSRDEVEVYVLPRSTVNWLYVPEADTLIGVRPNRYNEFHRLRELVHNIQAEA